MSDYYDEDDDYLFFDEEPYADAVRLLRFAVMQLSTSDKRQDDLAEHTMPSPVWLANEPVMDPNETIDELLLDSDDDEYFDQQRSAKRKRTSDGADFYDLESTDVPSKRRKMSMAGHVPDEPISKPLPPAPIVLWRTQGHSSVSYPIVSDGIEAGVALLKDWRERFKGSANSPTRGVKRQSSQIGFAVVIERPQKKDLDRQRLFPVENAKGGSVTKQRVAKSQVQDMQSSAGERRKTNNKLRSTASAVQRPALVQKRNTTAAASTKRKAPDTDDEEKELQVDDGISGRPKKRVMTDAKRPSVARAHRSASAAREPKRKESEPKTEASKLRTQRGTALPKTAAVASAENISKSKTKPDVKRSTLKKS